MVLTEFFYTITFICALITGVMVLMYFLCCAPDQERFTLFIKVIGSILLGGGKCMIQNN